jgi:hypothetical protein
MNLRSNVHKTRYPGVGYQRIDGAWYLVDVSGPEPVQIDEDAGRADLDDLLADLHARERAKRGPDAGLRYLVVEDSQSAHCCFEATVVDSHRPDDYENFEGEVVQRYEAICECFSEEQARLVADALNATASTRWDVAYAARPGDPPVARAVFAPSAEAAAALVLGLLPSRPGPGARMVVRGPAPTTVWRVERGAVVATGDHPSEVSP